MGGGDPPGPVEAPRAARRRARAPRARRGRGGRGLFGRILVRRTQGLHDDRRGRLGHAHKGRDNHRRQGEQGSYRLPGQLRQPEPPVLARAGSFRSGARGARHGSVGRGRPARVVRTPRRHTFPPTRPTGSYHAGRPPSRAPSRTSSRPRRRRARRRPRRRSARSRSSPRTSWRPRSAASSSSTRTTRAR